MDHLCPTCQQPASPGTNCPACGMMVPETLAQIKISPSTPHSLPKGTRLHNENYAVSDILGQGGFGITYKGGDLHLKRYVAIKEFFPLGSARQGTTVSPSGHITQEQFLQQRESFVREARTLAHFSHPGIVRVFSVFEENETAYIVMEMLHGKTLQQVLDEKGRLSEDETLDIIRQVGSALEVVHGTGMLHRDIKPDNILLVERPDQSPRAVLIDFGTARAFNAGQTRAMTAQLTPAYAPLEQYAQQAHFGAYTDIYALAGTCYHCLTGKLPPSAMDRLSGVDLVAPALVQPGIQPFVSRAVMHGLEVKAPDRPQNVRAFLQELEKPAQPELMPISYAQVPVWGAPPPVDGQLPLNSTPVKSGSQAWFVGVLLTFLVIGSGLIAWNSGRDINSPADPSQTRDGINPSSQPVVVPPSNQPVLTGVEIYNAASAQLESKLPSRWDYNIESYIEAGTNPDGSWTEPCGADQSAPGYYWATGSFKYSGAPITLKYKGQLVELDGREAVGGYTTVVWTAQLVEGPGPGQLLMTNIEFHRV